MAKVTVLLCFALLCAGTAYAENSLGFDVLAGVGTSGFDANGDVDVKPEGVKNPYEVSLSFARQYTTAITTSRTNQYTLGLDHDHDAHWNGRGDLTYWKDTINNIHYGGGTVGLTYTWTDAVTLSSPKSSLKDAAASEDETSTEPAPKNEIASLTFNVDVFGYGTEVEASSTTRRVFDAKLNRYVKKVVPPQSSTVKTTQIHPCITFEKPLFDAEATPYLTAGHYFYSTDPKTIEALTGRPRFASSVTRIDGLVGGFLKNNGEVGLRITLPLSIDSDFRLGADQEVSDNRWATTQGVTLSRLFLDHLRLKLDWNRGIQNGVSDDIFSTGLTYTF
jgi:hypothetical protein